MLINVRMADGSVSTATSSDAVVVYGVDAFGNYLGQVAPALATSIATCAPPAPTGWQWQLTPPSWQKVVLLADAIADAQAIIDAHGGLARCKYITNAPGQSAVYLRKSQQATQYAAAGFTGTVPPYIAQEAAATGVTATVLAQQINTITNLWDNQLSPAIEAARIGGKKTVGAATTIAAVATALASALASLATI